MADQYKLKNLADTISASATEINQRIKDDNKLSFEEVEKLSKQAKEMFIAGKTLYELTAIAIAEDNKESLKELEAATDKINNAIKTIKTVQTVIDITAKLVIVAGSIVSGNYASIPQNVADIINSLDEGEEE